MEAPARAAAPWEDRLAAGLRGFGPTGIFAILCILYATWYAPPLAFLMVLVWPRLSRTPWREIGYVRPRSFAYGVLALVVLAAL